ncbi:MAG: hypothetical protein LBJ37_22645, partial [Paucimonas sp.]|nr:hypothetical protein [Paucimonas sp.]
DSGGRAIRAPALWRFPGHPWPSTPSISAPLSLLMSRVDQEPDQKQSKSKDKSKNQSKNQSAATTTPENTLARQERSELCS